MTAHIHPATIHLWACDFASQPLAFAHILDEADKAAVGVDLDEVDVIPMSDRQKRLSQYFGEVPQLPPSPVLILLVCQPSVPCPFESTEHLNYLGSFQGRVKRARADWV